MRRLEHSEDLAQQLRALRRELKEHNRLYREMRSSERTALTLLLEQAEEPDAAA